MKCTKGNKMKKVSLKIYKIRGKNRDFLQPILEMGIFLADDIILKAQNLKIC